MPPIPGPAVEGPSPYRVDAVYFDLDGTLIDSTYLHTLAWWRALDEAGETRPMADIHPLIGMGGDEVMQTLIGRVDDAIHEAQGAHFTEYHRFLRPLPGATATLERVRDCEARAVVVTSAKEQDLPVLLAVLGGEAVVDEVVAGPDAGRAKPEPDLFTTALARTGVEPSHALAVGDAVWDVTAAGAAGVACVGVGTGGTDLATLSVAGAVAVYPSCTELLEHWGRGPFAGVGGLAGDC